MTVATGFDDRLLPGAGRNGVVIPIKLESSVSGGFIHKEFVTIHGNAIFKKKLFILSSSSKV